MAGSSDSEWVRAAVAEYEQPLLRYAMRLTNDLERARDVVQDTFLRLCRQSRADIEARLRIGQTKPARPTAQPESVASAVHAAGRITAVVSGSWHWPD